MTYRDTPYFSVGRATDLSGFDRILYRLFEILPGFLSLGTIVLTIVLSYYTPRFAALFIIIFDLYWFFKTIYLSMHLRYNWKRMKYMLARDWDPLLINLRYAHLTHLVILPFYNETEEVVDKSIASLLQAKWNSKNIIVVLAGEEKAGDGAQAISLRMKEKYTSHFAHFLCTTHPKGVPGEMPGKGSNIAYAAEEARLKILDPMRMAYTDVIVSAFDIDTVVYPNYFKCLTWNFLTVPDPQKTSFQPVPIYNNNIWDAPAFSRVVAMSATFWQMIQQERPERLATFSSHAVSFESLYRVGYWQKNMVSEDSRIFWNLFVANNGDYRVVPLAYPVSMDANLADGFWATMLSVYKQQRRWSWGVENVPYILLACVKNKAIPLGKKIRAILTQLEGFWSLATNPIMIFLLGWLPIVLGDGFFRSSLLSYNLPIITGYIMHFSMLGLVISALVSFSFLPPRPKTNKKRDTVYMALQWVLIPITITVFGAIPALEAQTRLFLGKYMGFWVTPKHRETTNA
ncbi:glycosyltransferase family 2 protein [Patescibacteria group bacterium]|nr:MAG: glycosyltransferase family 2 protein [Patescibacteria group bacterium]